MKRFHVVAVQADTNADTDTDAFAASFFFRRFCYSQILFHAMNDFSFVASASSSLCDKSIYWQRAKKDLS